MRVLGTPWGPTLVWPEPPPVLRMPRRNGPSCEGAGDLLRRTHLAGQRAVLGQAPIGIRAAADARTGGSGLDGEGLGRAAERGPHAGVSLRNPPPPWPRGGAGGNLVGTCTPALYMGGARSSPSSCCGPSGLANGVLPRHPLRLRRPLTPRARGTWDPVPAVPSTARRCVLTAGGFGVQLASAAR